MQGPPERARVLPEGIRFNRRGGDYAPAEDSGPGGARTDTRNFPRTSLRTSPWALAHPDSGSPSLPSFFFTVFPFPPPFFPPENAKQSLEEMLAQLTGEKKKGRGKGRGRGGGGGGIDDEDSDFEDAVDAAKKCAKTRAHRREAQRYRKRGSGRAFGRGGGVSAASSRHRRCSCAPPLNPLLTPSLSPAPLSAPQARCRGRPCLRRVALEAAGRGLGHHGCSAGGGGDCAGGVPHAR